MKSVWWWPWQRTKPITLTMFVTSLYVHALPVSFWESKNCWQRNIYMLCEDLNVCRIHTIRKMRNNQKCVKRLKVATWQVGSPMTYWKVIQGNDSFKFRDVQDRCKLSRSSSSNAIYIITSKISQSLTFPKCLIRSVSFWFIISLYSLEIFNHKTTYHNTCENGLK